MDDSKQSDASRACQHARAWVCSPKRGELSSGLMLDVHVLSILCISLYKVKDIHKCSGYRLWTCFDVAQTEIGTAAICWQYLDRFTPGGPIMQMHSFDCSFRQSCKPNCTKKKHEKQHRWPGLHWAPSKSPGRIWWDFLAAQPAPATFNVADFDSAHSNRLAQAPVAANEQKGHTPWRKCCSGIARGARKISQHRLEVLGVTLPRTTPSKPMSLPRQIHSVSDIVSAPSQSHSLPSTAVF